MSRAPFPFQSRAGGVKAFLTEGAEAFVFFTAAFGLRGSLPDLF